MYLIILREGENPSIQDQESFGWLLLTVGPSSVTLPNHSISFSLIFFKSNVSVMRQVLLALLWR